FGDIMAAVEKLEPGQGLRLIASFKPVPLFSVLGKRGFDHSERDIGDGDWEVLFTPTGAAAAAPAPAPAATATGTGDWPAPVVSNDYRDLPPPEPMQKVIADIE